MVGFGPEGHRALAAGGGCGSEVTVGRSRTDAQGAAHSGVSEGHGEMTVNKVI